MRRITSGFTLVLLACLFSVTLAFAENDAPHNASNLISCGSCHSDTILSSPFWGTPDDTTYNNFCLSNCHNISYYPYSDTGAPLTKAHSSANTSETYGTWSINCIECHDPHSQSQKLWKRTSSADLYLANGKIQTDPISADKVTYDADTHTSTFYFSSLSYNSGWDADSLTNKSLTERRGIFFPNLKKLGFSYSVIDIDDGNNTITVEGDATGVFEYVDPPTSFAIIYGQYIRQTIDANGTLTAVKLFSSSGPYSFAYNENAPGDDPTPNGICQVCHTKTSHWRNDGTLAAIGVHESFNGENCTNCHRHDEGFKNSYVDHSADGYSYILGSVNCISCHSATDPVLQIHQKNCSYCHKADMSLQDDLGIVDADNGGTCIDCHSLHASDFEAGHLNETHTELTGSSNCTTTCHSGNLLVNIHGNDTISTCTNCHTDAVSNGTLKGSASSHTVGTPSACADCHSSHNTNFETGHTAEDHTGISASTNCTNVCHTQTTATNIVNITHATTGCTNCHTNTTTDGTLKNATNGDATGGTGNCVSCHSNPFATQHSSVDHSTFVSMATDCSGCHTATGSAVDPADAQVHDSCAACHAADGALVGSALGHAGGGSCNTCHGVFETAVHQNVDHSTRVSLASDCSLCHDGAKGAVNGMPIASGNNKIHDACATCHGTTGVLVGLALNKTGDNDCESCHGAYFPSHVNPDQRHDNRIISFGAQSNSCDKCHKSNTTLGLGVPGAGALASQSDIDSLHGRATNACNLCHFYNAATQSNTEDLPLAVTVQNAIANGMDATPVAATCITCHAYNEDPATHGAHLVPDNITTKLKTCTVCHDRDEANPLQVVDDIHKLTCANCHATPQPPTLLDAATKPNADFIVKGDCGDCHGVDYDHDNDTHAKITYGNDPIGGNGTCIGCHVPDPITEHMDIRGWDCAICHSNPCYDDIINDAINDVTNTVYCTDCHTARDFPHGMIDHVGLGKVREDMLCSSCHNPDNTLDWIVDTHGNGTVSDCGLCHVNPLGAGPLIAVLEGNGNAVNGGICSECHNASLTMPNLGAFHGTASDDSETISRHNNLVGATGVAVASTNSKIISTPALYKCNDCHLARTVQERLEEHPGCVTCHNGLAGFEAIITAGMASGGNAAQDCEACHNNTINGGGSTNSPTSQAMYQYDGDRHHALEHAQAGRCDHCHTDPRPTWAATYSATLPDPLPSQLPCLTCHMDITANGVVVKKNTFTPAAVYFPSATGYNLSSVASVVQATQHTITGASPIAVTNYGACLTCHSINVWHAKPEWNRDVNDSASSNSDDPFDVLRKAPGRSWWPSQPTSSDNNPLDNGGTALFDIFSSAVNTGGATKVRMFGRYDFGDANKPYERTGSENRGDRLYKNFKNTNPWINTLANAPLGFTRVTIPEINAINDAEGQMSSNPQVPVFADIAIPAVTGADLVTIIDAGWNDQNSSKLDVMAVNRHDNSVALTVTYGSQIAAAPMTWDATHGAWTYTSATTVIFDGSNVVVNSNHAGGGTDTITPRDMTVTASEAGAATTTQAHIDNAANNIPNTVLAAGACTVCHVGNLALEHAKRGKSCSVCHAPCAVPPTPLSSVDCFTCHYDNDPTDPRPQPANHPADAVPSHFFLEYDPPKCVTCHDNQNIATATHSSCSNCHDAAYNLANMQSGPSGNAKLHVLLTNSACTVCHPAQDTNFGAGHLNEDHALITGSAQCISCHSGADKIVDVHNNNCNNCHTDSATDGTLTGSASDHTIGVASTCADCHTTHAANFVTGHQNEDHANVVATAAVPIIENCVGCHPGNVITDADLHNSVCEKCHTNQTTDGSLKGSASGHVFDTQSGCADCHNTYFTDHSHVHSIIEIDIATDLAQSDSQVCYNCHNDNSNNLATWADILVEHRSLCSTCHNATRVTGNGAAPAETVQDVIAAKTNPTNCLDCHWTKNAPATHTVDHVLQGRVADSAQCTSCHDKDAVGTDDYYINTIHDMATNGCGLCHVAAGGAGPLVAPYETNSPAGGTCVACHIAYGTNFGTGHQNQDHSGLAATITGCITCHNGLIVTSPNTHDGSCTRCHNNTTTNGSLRAGTNGTAAGHYLGTSSDCDDCHSDYVTDFDDAHTVEDHSGISGTASCQGCHNGNIITGINTHNSQCTLCHTNLSTNGNLKSGSNGDATNHSPGSSSTCLTCHSDYTPDFNQTGTPTAHKVKDHSGLIDPTGVTPTTNCIGCHDGVDTRPIIEWYDDFTGLTTGNAGRSTFGNWTGVNGSDGTNPWMVWTSSSTSSGTGPSTGFAGGGEYVLLESSTTTPSAAIVSRLGNWSKNKAATTGNAILNYTPPAGSNRVMVVTVSAEDSGQVNITGATYGGQALTYVNSAVQGTGYSNETWIGICNETCISNATGTIVSATFTGIHSTGMAIGAATYQNVDQTTPISHSNSFNSTANSISTSVTNPAGGMVVYMVEYNGVGANSITPPAGFTEIAEIDTTGSGFRSEIGERNTTGSGSVTITPTNTGVNSSRSTIVGIALNPSSGDEDATNGVNVTSSSSHYLESATLDASAASLVFSFAWNMNVGNNSDATLHVDGWNGSTWDLDIPGGAINTGNYSDSWVSAGPFDLNSYNNADFKLRIRYEVGTGIIYHNDLALDNLEVVGTPKVPTLFTYNDNFSGLITGNAGRSTFGNWTGVNGSDGTNPWMAWTGSTATPDTGPANGAGGSGNYLTIESSSTTPAATSPVAIIGSWSTNYTTNDSAANLSYSVPPGSNRVMIVALSAEDNGLVDITGVTYGGQTVTLVESARQGAGYSNISWIGICDETCISSATNTTLSASFSTALHQTGMTIAAATYANVNQSTPVNDSNKFNTTANSVSINVSNPTGGKVIYIVEYNGVGANSVSPASGFTEIAEFNTTGSGYRAEIGERTSTASGTVSVNPSNTGVASNRTTIAALSLNPVVGDSDAVNGVNITANSTHYLESPVMDASLASITFDFTWNMNVGNNTDASLHVDAWNGSSWDNNIGGSVNAGDNGNNWVNASRINFSSYTNADFKIRVRYEVGTGATYKNDVAIDNLKLIGADRDIPKGDIHYDECTSCHANNGTGALQTKSRGDATVHELGVDSECATCHSPFGYFDSHLHGHDVRQGSGDTSQSNAQACSNCHGVVSMWSNILTLHGSECVTCHEETRDINPVTPTNTTVQDVINNATSTVRCLNCHDDKYAPSEHGTIDHEGLIKVTWTARCETCHNVGGNQDVIYDVHKVGTKNLCGVCHANPYGVGPLREPWETDSPAGGECTICHGVDTQADHHAREQAQGGDCTFCHADPRPTWAGLPGGFTPTPMAKQLACVECHVESTGTGLVVYANTYNPVNVTGFPNGSNSVAISGGTRVQQAAVHTIPGLNKINVYDYGACLNCHDGNTAGAPQIQVWHAKPTWDKNTHDASSGLYDNPFDSLRYAPGRSEINSSGSVVDVKYNIFYNGTNTGTTKVRMFGRYNFGDSGKPYKGTSSQNRGDNLYKNYKNTNPWTTIYSQRFQIPCLNSINDPEGICGATDPQVPYYNDIAEPVIKDNVLILKAEWDGVSLSVWAYNDYQDSKTLTLDYGISKNNSMTWNATSSRWEGTLASPYYSTATVKSNAVGGGTDTANVTDLTAIPDTLFVTRADWTSSNGGTLTIYSDHLVNNGSLTYEVSYGNSDLGAMTWNGVERRYELTTSGLQYLGDTLVHIESADRGGDSADIPVEDVSGPPDDAAYATRAVWDGNNADTLTVFATHKLNSGVLTYKVDYNGFNNMAMTWKSTRFRYELVMPAITFGGTGLQARVYSDDPGGDDINIEVTDISGTVDHETLGHVTQTSECAKCHNWNPNDPKDVVTDTHLGKCTYCHTLWPALRANGPAPNNTPIARGNCEDCHGADYHPAATLHNQITYGFGGNSCLMSCHKEVPLDEHLTGAVTGRTWQCTSCHASPYYIGIINAAIPITDPEDPKYNVYCTDCHANQVFPHGLRHHDITNLGNCVPCHSSVDVVSDIHKSNCVNCHGELVADGGTVPDLVGAVITAGGGDCADCHINPTQPTEYQHKVIGYHNNSILKSCIKCHAATTFDDIVDTHRDSCATCHTSTNPNVIATIDLGGEVQCSDCHTESPISTPERHHNNDNTQNGKCGYCHDDKRPDWISTYSTITPSPWPRQLACIKCHVESTGTGLVVYKNVFTATNVTSFPSGDSAWNADGAAAAVQDPIHTIEGAAKINVYDYGICFDCHFYDPDNPDNPAKPVQVWHAKPTVNDTSSAYDNPFDVYRNHPGRSYWANGSTPPQSTSDATATDRRFNIFANTTGTGGVARIRIAVKEHYKNTSSENRGDRLYQDYRSTSQNPWYGSIWGTRTTIPRVNDQNNRESLLTSNPSVPYYANIADPGTTPMDDYVTITMAHWYETDHDAHLGDLIIQAANRETDTLQYNAANMTSSGAHWEITLNNVANPGTVTVTSTHASAASDNATVIDMTCYTCIETTSTPHDYVENLVDPSCAACHLASLPDEHAVHNLSCSNCHENPDPVVLQAIKVGTYGGVTCETCHGVRTAEHPYDLHTHSVHLDGTDLGQDDNQSCGNCHQSALWSDIETGHRVSTNGPGACNTCHLSARAEVIDTILYRTSGDAHCLSCHSLMAAPAVHGNDHPIMEGAGDISQIDSQPCSNCHGSLADWKDVYVVHLNNCDTCHLATRDINPLVPTGTTVPDIVADTAAVEVNCLDCHADKPAPDEHGLEHHFMVPGMRDSEYNATLTCFTAGCHAGTTFTEHMRPGGIAYQKYEDLGTTFECDWCHQYRPTVPGMAAYNDDPAIDLAISRGVNNQEDIYCSDCHAYNTQRHDPLAMGWTAKYADSDYRVSSKHHDNHADALTGNCQTCHIDLREDRYGEGLPVPTPKKLACIACHVDQDPLGGSLGTGQMTVYKSKTADIVDRGTYYTWDWTFTGPIANTDAVAQTGMPHQWNVVGGIIDNFGTCLFCHRIGPFHAKPAAPADDVDKDVVDLINDPPYRQNVGRGLFNAFFGSYREPFDYYTGFAQSANQAEYMEIRDSDSWAINNVTWAKVIYDPYTDPRNNLAPTHTLGVAETFIVPTFDAPLGGDTVTITNTTFNSGPLTLDVTATNTSTGMGYELYAIHDGKNVLMTESPAGTWNGTITGYPFNISDEPGSVYVISIDPSSDNATLAQDATNPTPVVNNAPAITITAPGGAGATVTQGANYTITYNLSDAEDVVTAAIYYDTDNTGLNGTAIGACATEPEATGGTCSFDTTGVTPGTYYIYAVSNDGTNPAVSAYSSGTLTINPLSVTVGSGAGGVYQSSTENWQLALYDLNNPFTLAASGTVVDFTVNVTNPGNFTLFVCAPTGGEGGTCAVNATLNVSTPATGTVTWSGLSMPISSGEVIGIWHAAGDGIGEKLTTGWREQYQINAALPTNASTINGTSYGVSLMMEATVEYQP